MVAMAFMNLALFETWQFVPNSSKENCGHSFVAGVIHYRVRFIIVENLQHILCTENAKTN